MAETPHVSTSPPLTTDDEGEKLKKKEFEQRMEEQRIAQNLPEGAVPEQRPIASQTVDDPHSRVFKELQDAGDDRGGVPAMDKAAYDRAQSDAQARKAAKESETPDRFYPGARAYIENPGAPDHGRAVAINRVEEFASFQDQALGSSGVPAQMNAAKVKSYECRSRDGRAELLIVDAEHLRRSEEADWGKTPIS